MNARWGWIPIVALAAGLASCTSDEFGSVGSRLPLDAGQDSLLVRLEPMLVPIVAADFAAPEADSIQGRQVLYVGNRDAGNWRATPLLRFDFSEGFPAEIDTADVIAVTLEMEALIDVREKPDVRTVRIVELTQDLQTSDADRESVDPLLGATLVEADLLKSTTIDIELPRSRALEWAATGGHTGLAIYDLFPSVAGRDSANFWGLASSDLLRLGTFLDPNSSNEFPFPELKYKVPADADSFVTYPTQLDFTHFQRDVNADDLTLGSHLPSRIFLRFDVEGSGVPGNATVNEAILRLFVREETSLGEAGLVPASLRAYEATLEDAESLEIADLETVLRSGASFDAAIDDTLEVDVTDYVQRAINLVVGPEVGLVLSFDDSEIELNVADIYGPEGPVGSRPQLDILFTPPADYWR